MIIENLNMESAYRYIDDRISNNRLYKESIRGFIFDSTCAVCFFMEQKKEILP